LAAGDYASAVGRLAGLATDIYFAGKGLVSVGNRIKTVALRHVDDINPIPPLARPSIIASGNVILGELDDIGKPSGVVATITEDMIGTGSAANPAIRPPDFAGGANNHSRGHLLANILGGSGTDARDLVTMFKRNANSPNMRHFENQKRSAIDGGEVVNFRVIPIYSGNRSIPSGVTMTARGSGGFNLDVSVQNINGLAQ